MTTYLLMNLVFMTLIFLIPRRYRRTPWRLFVITLAIMIGLTAIFDPVIIGLDIVDYDFSKTLGILWFGAPIEDFFYAIFSVMLVPALWRLFGKEGKEQPRGNAS